MKKRIFAYIIGIGLFSNAGFAQVKEIGDEEITITKDRKIELPKANRIFEKIPPIKTESKEKKMAYTFFDRKPTNIEEVKFSPNTIQTNSVIKKDETNTGYPNYFKVGLGNFGRIYAETYVNSAQDQKLVFGIYGLHNSTKRGPIYGVNSGSSNNEVKLDGKYHNNDFEVKADISYDRRNYHFFGYDSTYNYQKNEIRQTLNTFKFGVAFENTKPSPIVDYSLKTNLRLLNDAYDASEIDWGTKFDSYFPIIKDKVTAVLAAEAFITQRTDNYLENPTRKRNLFRVEPSFNVDVNRFNAKIGFKAVNEYDEIKDVNSTKGFPTITLTYKTPSLTYFFLGYDGDIVRNTLGSFLNENPYLVSQLELENTQKNQEYFIGSRGQLFSGLSFDTKASYGFYKNMYYFNTDDADPATRRFQVYYDPNKTKFVNVSAELNYENSKIWRTNLKANYYYFETKEFEKPFHRPSFTSRLGNTFIVSDKIVANLDFYLIGRTYAKDPFALEIIKIPSITDLNAEITYLFSKQFSTFVKLNNIIGNKYERYYNYPNMGLNFLVGANFSL